MQTSETCDRGKAGSLNQGDRTSTLLPLRPEWKCGTHSAGEISPVDLRSRALFASCVAKEIAAEKLKVMPRSAPNEHLKEAEEGVYEPLSGDNIWRVARIEDFVLEQLMLCTNASRYAILLSGRDRMRDELIAGVHVTRKAADQLATHCMEDLVRLVRLLKQAAN